MEKMLFVCLGNICRSPMAEAVMKEKIKRAGLTHQVVVRSAATSSFEVGSAPHQGTQRILKKYGISFDNIYSRQVTPKDFETFDLIIGMDQQNIDDLMSIAPDNEKEKIHLFMECVPEFEKTGVPDPYYTGNFEETYQMVDQGTDSWLDYLKKMP